MVVVETHFSVKLEPQAEQYLFIERFEHTAMLEIETRGVALFDQMGENEPELPSGPTITLMDFLNRRPETIESNQFVEVNISISFSYTSSAY